MWRGLGRLGVQSVAPDVKIRTENYLPLVARIDDGRGDGIAAPGSSKVAVNIPGPGDGCRGRLSAQKGRQGDCQTES